MKRLMTSIITIGILAGYATSSHADADINLDGTITSPDSYTEFYLPASYPGNGNAMFSSNHSWDIYWVVGTSSTSLSGTYEWALNPGEGSGSYNDATLNVTVSYGNRSVTWGQNVIKNVTRGAGTADATWRLCYARTTIIISSGPYQGTYNYLNGPLHWRWTNTP